MSLGANRDYKTNARRVKANLAMHYELMQQLKGRGCPENVASKIAAAKVLGERCPVCHGRGALPASLEGWQACYCLGCGL